MPTGEKAKAEFSPAGLKVDSVPHYAHRAPGQRLETYWIQAFKETSAQSLKIRKSTKEYRLHKMNSEKSLNIQTTMKQFSTKKIKRHKEQQENMAHKHRSNH